MTRRGFLRLCLVAAICLFAGAERSGEWAAVRRTHLRSEPECVACGAKTRLEVHHIIPVDNDPSRELDATNLITLCRRDHLTFGHFGNTKRYNPKVRKHAETYRRWKTEWERD